MDLSKCFDSLNHDLILKGVNRLVSDGSVLNLISLMLKSGIIEGKDYQASEQGSPQGGVISPLLMNIYLDSFDQYMKSLGIRIVRYADDILILARTRSEAGKYKSIAENYLEKTLKLTVNRAKTRLTNRIKGVSYLGFVITRRGVSIHSKSKEKFKEKVRPSHSTH